MDRFNAKFSTVQHLRNCGILMHIRVYMHCRSRIPSLNYYLLEVIEPPSYSLITNSYSNALDSPFCLDGYRLWVNFYPNDTTNSKPNENFNKGTDVPITGRLLTDSNLSSQSGGLKGRGEPVTAEQLRKLTWQPESFEQNVRTERMLDSTRIFLT